MWGSGVRFEVWASGAFENDRSSVGILHALSHVTKHSLGICTTPTRNTELEHELRPPNPKP